MKHISAYCMAVLYFLFCCTTSQSMQSEWHKGKNNIYTYAHSLNSASLTKERWKNAVSGLHNLEASDHRTIEIHQDQDQLRIEVFQSERKLNEADSKILLRTLIIKTYTQDSENNTDKLNVATCIGSLKQIICSSDDADTAPALHRFQLLFAHEILPTIKSKLARHVGQELAKMVIIAGKLTDFEPVNQEALKKIKKISHELQSQQTALPILLRIKKYELSNHTSQSQDEAFIKDYETLLDITTTGAS